MNGRVWEGTLVPRVVSIAEVDPDMVQNRLTLSGTVHWHLTSPTDGYGLLVSHNKVPAELRELCARQLDRIHLPENPAFHPHPGFVQRHRERLASG